jgi:hypothetical protein
VASLLVGSAGRFRSRWRPSFGYPVKPVIRDTFPVALRPL